MLAGWVPPGGSEGESVPRFSRSFSLAAALGLPCVQLHNFDLSAPHDMAFLPVCLCVSKLPSSFFFFFKPLFICLHQVSVVACRLLSSCGVWAPEPSGSAVATQRLSCPVACGTLVP